MQFYQTQQVLHAIPSQENFGSLPETWGGEGAYGWFRGSYTVPAELDGQALFLRPLTDGYEATLWVNGCVHSNYARKEIVGSHGNHYCNRIRAKAEAGERIELALEYYAYHRMPGTQPLQYEAQDSFVYRVGDVQVCLRDEAVFDYYFDLRTLLELCQAPSTPAFRRADELAVAMESRCYHGGEGRTHMKQAKMVKIDFTALTLGVLFVAGMSILKHI